MDRTAIAILIHELRNQCLYTEAAFKVFNQALEQQSPAGAFYAAQSALLSASQIASILWPTRAAAKKRGEAMRQALGLEEKHVLNNKSLAQVWENADKKLDDWVSETKGQQVVFDHLGPISAFDQKDFPEGHIFRLYDPETMIFYYRGDGYKMQIIANAITEVFKRVATAHQTIFPDQYKDGGTTPAAAKAPSVGDATKKPAAEKAPTKKKAPVKKKTAAKKTKTAKKK